MERFHDITYLTHNPNSQIMHILNLAVEDSPSPYIEANDEKGGDARGGFGRRGTSHIKPKRLSPIRNHYDRAL